MTEALKNKKLDIPLWAVICLIVFVVLVVVFTVFGAEGKSRNVSYKDGKVIIQPKSGESGSYYQIRLKNGEKGK